jgi:hypothetical protein
MKSIAIATILALAVAGCSGAAVAVNPNTKYPIQASEAAPAFLFPINMSHLNSGGDPLKMGIAVSAGVATHFGSTVVSGQQLFDLVGNLSYDLAEKTRAQVKQKSWMMTGSAEPVAKKLSNLMENIIAKLVELKLLASPIQFKYIIVLHSHGEKAMAGKMLKVSSWGGIYDSETKEILSYIDSTDSFPADKPDAILAQLPLTYNHMIDKLLNGTPKVTSQLER